MSDDNVKARWLDFAARLRNVGLGIFNGTRIKVTDQRSADVKVLGLMLLARTLSNLKAALALVDGGFIVEAKTVARCCYENSYLVGALVKEGYKFRTAMVHHEMKHKRMRAQTIFATTEGLKGEIGDKLRGWMQEHKNRAGHFGPDPLAWSSPSPTSWGRKSYGWRRRSSKRLEAKPSGTCPVVTWKLRMAMRVRGPSRPSGSPTSKPRRARSCCSS